MHGLVFVQLAVYATSLLTVCIAQGVCYWLCSPLAYYLYTWPRVCAVGSVCHFLINCMHGTVFVLLSVYATSLLTESIAQCLCC